MFKINFNISPDYIKKSFTTNLDKKIAYVKSIPDKVFKLSFGEKSYDIRYELDDNGEIKLYVQNDSVSDKSLAIPNLRLNIGDILLPESMSIDGPKDNSTYDSIEYIPYKTVGYNKLSDKELRKIYDKIIEIGLLNLLKNEN